MWATNPLIICSLQVRCTGLARQMQERETRAVGGRLAFKKADEAVGLERGRSGARRGTVCR